MNCDTITVSSPSLAAAILESFSEWAHRGVPTTVTCDPKLLPGHERVSNDFMELRELVLVDTIKRALIKHQTRNLPILPQSPRRYLLCTRRPSRKPRNRGLPPEMDRQRAQRPRRELRRVQSDSTPEN
nr:hypothetical protein Iba_chr08eCG10390 [Ipomoea batatas]